MTTLELPANRCTTGPRVLGNTSLLRLQLTLLLLEASAPTYAAALLVYAFGRGGAAAAGLVMVVTMAPAAAAAPFAAVLVDRLPRERVLVAAAASRGLLLALAAVLIGTGAPAVSTYAVAAVASIVARIGFPARAALLPDVTRSDEELAAANSLGGVIESAASVGGPALAGGLLVFAGPATVVAFASGIAFVAAVAAAGVRPRAGSGVSRGSRGGGRAELLEGFRLVFSDPRLRVVVGVLTLQLLSFGALAVTVVELALHDLGLGAGGVGLLNGAMGIGGVLGGVVAGRLVSRFGARAAIVLGGILWGLPLMAAGLAPGIAGPVILLALAGAGSVVLDVPGYTLLQACAPREALGRVFGVLEALLVGAVAAGSLLGGVLLSCFGTSGAMLVVGALVPVAMCGAWPAFRCLLRP